MKDRNCFREITIPGDVLEDENLSDGAKIMYGKIARLSYKEGYCCAGNSFLDGTKTGRNASRFIAELLNAGYIIVQKNRSKYREIRIFPVESKVHIANFGEVDTEGYNSENDSTSPNLAGLSSIPRQIRRGNIANNGEVHIAESGEQTLQDSTNLNTTATTTPPGNGEAAVVELFEPEKDTSNGDAKEFRRGYGSNSSGGRDNAASHKPFEKTSVKAAASLSPEEKELKDAILAVDNTLILRADFYSRAAAFIRLKEIDSGYLAWLHQECSRKNYNSFDGLYYSLFFADNMVEKYKAIHKPPAPAAPPPPDIINCPVCGTVHDKLDEMCPVCSLPKDASSTQVSLYLELQTIPLERRIEYMRRENLIYSEFNWDFVKLKTMNDALKKEFGLKVENEIPSRSVYSR